MRMPISAYNMRDENMMIRKYYECIQYYFVHSFRGISHMLFYCAYRNTMVHNGLVEDTGNGHYDMQDIRTIQHLYAKVKTRGKVYFVDAPGVMEECIRSLRVIGAQKQKWYSKYIEYLICVRTSISATNIIPRLVFKVQFPRLVVASA